MNNTADGSVEIEITADDKQAAKVLANLKTYLKQLERDLAGTGKQKTGLEEKLQKISSEMDRTGAKLEELQAKYRASKKWTDAQEKSTGLTRTQLAGSSSMFAEKYAEQDNLQKQINELIPKQDELNRKAQELETTLQKINEIYAQQQAQVADVKSRIGQMESAQMQKANEATRSLKDSAKGAGDAANASIPSFNKLFKSILKWGFGIKSVFILVKRLKAVVVDYYKTLAKSDDETAQNINGLKSALVELKGAFGAAFAPIINAIAPMLQKLIQLLVSAANAVARFMAALAGKGSYKRAVANTAKIGSNLSGAAGAAGELNRELAKFDELNVLSDNNSGGGGGGSDGDYELVDELISSESLAARLAFTIKDVLFNWANWSPEMILEKIIAFAPMAAGAVVGGIAGGIPGIIIGAAVGFAFGVLADAITFDGDGKISTDELRRLLAGALTGMLAGGIIAISAAAAGAGAGAALLAFTIGITLGLVILGISDPVKNQSKDAIHEYVTGLDGEFSNAKVGTYEYQYYQRFKDYANRQMQEAGTMSADGYINGIDEEMNANDNLSPWQRFVESIKNILGIHSPSVVFHEIGVNVIQGMWDGLKERWENLMAWWQGLSLGSFDFKTPHLQVAWDSVDSVLSRFLGITKLPRLNVQWYARGGIVNGTTLFGAGEAGKEAVIPLERHTEWIKMVADGIADILIDRFAGAMPALPAMAGGNVLPPKMEYALGRAATEGEDSLLTMLQDISNKLDALNSRPIEVNSPVYIDKRKIGEAVTEYQRANDRARGR